jgi:phosphatidylglycerol---prolipoprotein diacylglyceryl transferase
MSIVGPYVHSIDPIIGSLFGVQFWWYGLSYALGFLGVLLFVRHKREYLGFSTRSVYELSLLLAGGVLVGGRLVEVAFYEWPFYREHLHLIPAMWLGGMATHGLLAGGIVGVWVFCRVRGKSFLRVTDALSIPAAFILGIGRLGNFIDGQIVGSVTSVRWAVKFPDAEGYRHPVVLYDGIKNLLLIPVLYFAGLRRLPPGVLTGLFLFLYAFLRLFVDLFREYPTTLLGLATGQALNILMSMIGIALIILSWRRGRGPPEPEVARVPGIREGLEPAGVSWRHMLFVVLLLFALVIPSDWTQDVPARYGSRHPGLRHSVIYPQIDTAAPGAMQETPADVDPGRVQPTSD